MKLQMLHANNFQQVTSKPFRFLHRQHKLLYPVLCKESFQQLVPSSCGQLHQLFRFPCCCRHTGHAVWTQDLNAKEKPFFLLYIVAAAVQWKRGESQLLWEICGIDFCCFSSIARDQWGARAKERWPSLAWSFTSILPLLQPACTFHSIMEFKCHGIDLSGNKFSQRQSLKKPSLCKGVLAHYNEGWKIQYASHSVIQNWFPIGTHFTEAIPHSAFAIVWTGTVFPLFFPFIFSCLPSAGDYFKAMPSSSVTSKAKQAKSAARILAALHHILKLFLEPKKHITHFILLLVKEDLVANSKKSHLWNMPALGLILPGAPSAQFPPTLCFLQESGLYRIGLS